MHIVAPAIESAVHIPLLHVVDATAAAVRQAGVRRVGLLGTRFTMEQPFYVQRLQQQGLDVLLPDADDRALVHRVIYEELCQGQLLASSREDGNNFSTNMVSLLAEGRMGLAVFSPGAVLSVDLVPTT